MIMAYTMKVDRVNIQNANFYYQKRRTVNEEDYFSNSG